MEAVKESDQGRNNNFKTLDINKNQSVNIMKTGGASDFF
jgi:hypothetical protein